VRTWKADDLREANQSFKVLHTTEKTQFATMTLAAGETSGEFGNEHADSDQWLVVLAGRGEAIGEPGKEEIGPGDVVLIPAPEKHQFRCTGPEPLRTLTFYGPPGYPGLD
jgi:mannose-6-phosphate isomerase-like protein (cupin superfamily)